MKQVYFINEKLEAAIDNTDMNMIRKSLYKKILEYDNRKISVSRLAMEVMPSFLRREDIKKIKYELAKIESEEIKNATQD